MRENLPVPPPDALDLPVVHKISELYCLVHDIGSRLPKRDKLGLWLAVERTCLDIHKLAIGATLEQKKEQIAVSSFCTN